MNTESSTVFSHRQTNQKWLDQVTYADGLQIQDHWHNQVHETGKGMILGLEHSATISLGRRSKEEVDLLSPLECIQAEGINVLFADRGGEATLHSPGQLVIYPLLPLRTWHLGVRQFVSILMQTTKNCLAEYGVKVNCQAGEPGLYSAKGKMAFFGIRVRTGISLHGLSINVHNDTSLFRHIRSCGKAAETFDRLGDYQPELRLFELFDQWCYHFSSHLERLGS